MNHFCIILLIGLGVLISCTEEDIPNTREGMLAGVWKLGSFERSGCDMGIDTIENLKGPFPFSEGNNDSLTITQTTTFGFGLDGGATVIIERLIESDTDTLLNEFGRTGTYSLGESQDVIEFGNPYARYEGKLIIVETSISFSGTSSYFLNDSTGQIIDTLKCDNIQFGAIPQE